MNYKKLLITIFALGILLSPVLAFGQNNSQIEDLLDDAAGSQGAGYDTNIDKDTSIATFAGYIVRVFLSLTGIIFVAYIIYGGFMWLTSGGNEEKITKAKSILRNGIIGLIVIFSAAAIYLLVESVVVRATTST